MVEEMKVPEGYKKTEVGVIPEDWEVKTLGDCLEEKPSYGINAAAVPYNNDLPTYIRITDISEEGRFIKSNRTSVICDDINKYQLKENDIVFARTGASTGKSYLYDPNDGVLVFAGFLIRARINMKHAIPKYVKACVGTSRYWNWVKMISTRSGQPGINGSEYASFIIPVPPLSEQQAIAEALSDVDNLITSLEKLIDKKQKIKQGAMQELLTGRKRLPGFTGRWEKKKLGEKVKIRKGYQMNKDTLPNNGKYPVINGGIEPSGYTFDWNTQENTITISEGGNSCGYVNLIKRKFWSGGHCYTVHIKDDDLDNLYLYYLLKFNEMKIMALRVGSGLPNIQRNSIEEFQIKYAKDIEEQQAIAQILSDMDAEIESLNNKLNKYKAIKQGMMQELLTGRIRLV